VSLLFQYKYFEYLQKRGTGFFPATMAAVEPEKRISLKLMVLKEQSKVIFAEARKDFVDVLFIFLTLPLGTIFRLVRKELKLQSPELDLSKC